MTHITYEPQMPGMAFDGHAGAGPYGGDVVCAALSALMYTLIAALPDDTAVEMGDGHCRVRGGGPEPYEVIAAGLRLLAEAYPEHVRMEVKA